MPRVRSIALLILPLVFLAGCSALFDFNLYKDLGLDPVTAPRASDYAGAGGLDHLAADLSSPAVIDALAADAAAKAELEAFLQGLISGGVDTPEEQQASILLADLELKTTGGEEFVNNIVMILMAPIDTSVKVTDLLRSIIPPEVAGNRIAFSAMLNGLVEADAQYNALGVGLDADPPADGDGLVDAGKSLPPMVNAGDVAQKAGVAFIAAAIVAAVDAADSGPDAAHAIDQMFNLLYDVANLDVTLSEDMTMPDPYTSATTREVNALKALYDAAGMTIPS
jgi:hypothetical protein